jgi:hypothetical protein
MTKLMPHLLELTNDEKHSIPKMKDKTVAFVTKSYEHAVNNPILVPAYVDVIEFKKDTNAVTLLRQFQNPLMELMKALEDTMTVAGSEAYISALSFYTSVKSAAKNNVPGAQVVYEDLSIRFKGQGRGKSTKTPPIV